MLHDVKSASALKTLECTRCGRGYDPDRVCQLCECGSPLFARYDFAVVRKSLTLESLEHRPADLWRYRELLPVRNDDAIISLGERMTPIIPLRRLGRILDLPQLFVKDEGLLPTGSFKARGAAVGVSRASELGVKAFAMPTNGNAGSAWSMYGARAGMNADIVLPSRAPAIHRLQCALAGARVFVVDGLISEAGRIVGRSAAKSGLYDASTFKDPYRIEGNKTMAFEIAEQFEWQLPDVIVCPTGGGEGLIGIHKGLLELQALDLIDKRLPRFVAVQASGCAPLVAAWRERQISSTYWEDASTVAFGINVPKALGDVLALRVLYDCDGSAVAVDDSDILEHQRMLIAEEGVLACPEGGAALASVAALRRQGAIRAHERVLIINTGSGALYPDAPYPEPETLGPNDELPIAAQH